MTDDGPVRALRAHVRSLHRVMMSGLTANTFSLPDINREMDLINKDIRTLAYANVAPPLIAKLRNEIGVI
ncbi:MAG: hypothetical protein WC295_07770, partial [Methanoregula sp.]